MTTYVVDTCAINRMVDGVFDASSLPSESELVISHIQIDELNNTTDVDKDRRARLHIVLSGLRPKLVLTESFV